MTATLSTFEDLLQKFPTELHKQIEFLWCKCNFGLSNSPFKVEINSIKYTRNGAVHHGNWFILVLPYAGTDLRWKINYIDENLNFAPDICFIGSDFLSIPNLQDIKHNVPSWGKYSVDNEMSLVDMVSEFYTWHKKWNVEVLEQNKLELYNAYKEIIDVLDIKEDDIEVYNGTNNIAMLIKIKLKDDVPKYLLSADADYSALLKINFSANHRTTKVQLSDSFTSISGNRMVNIPPFTKDIDLTAYVLNVRNTLDNLLVQVCEDYELRQEYLNVLITKDWVDVLEYDRKHHRRAIVLVHINNSEAILNIQIGDNFPKQKPQITVRSIYYEVDETAITERLTYQWDPKDKPNDMVNKLKETLDAYIPKFKNTCLRKIQTT